MAKDIAICCCVCVVAAQQSDGRLCLLDPVSRNVAIVDLNICGLLRFMTVLKLLRKFN